MSDAQTTIDLIFNGVDRTGAATLAALDNAKKFSGSVKDITAPIADFTMGAVKLEAGMLAAGAALTVFAVTKASEFQGAMLDLQKVMNESDGPIEQFADAAREMSNEFGVASTDVLQSVANFKQAGFTANEALTLTRDALNLKIAGDVEAARASELLVASLKGFNLEASEGARIVDLLNEVSNRYATDVNQLGEGFARLSPVAKAAGLSLEETAGILTPGIEVFRSGAEVANALRTVLLRLQDDSKPVRQALEDLGVTQFTANGELRSARDIYFDVAKAFGPLTDSQKTFYANQLAGIEQSSKFIAVMQGIDKTLAISSDKFLYFGSAAKEVEIRLRSTETQVARMTESFTNMFIAIGTPLLDETSGLANAISKIFLALANGAKSGGLAEFVTYIENQMKSLVTSVETVAKNLPAALAKADFSGFKGGIDAVINAVQSLFGGLDLTSVDGLRSEIETMGAAFLGLSLYVSGVVESFKPLFDTLVAVGSGAKDADLSFLSIAGSLGGLVTQLNIALPLFDVLIGLLAAKSGLGLVKELTGLSSLLPSLVSGMGLLASTGALAGAGLGGLGIGSGIYEGVSALITKITGSENTLGTWVYNMTHADEAAQALGASTTKAAGKIQDMSQATAGVAGDFGAANQAMLDNYAASEKLATSTGKVATAQKDVSLYTLQTVPVFDALTGAITGYEQQLVKSTKGTIDLGAASSKAAGDVSKVAAETEKSKEAARKWSEELAKMASAEKIALIGAQQKIVTAGIEADAKKAVAAYESLNTTIKATSDNLGSMLNLYKDSNTMDFSTIRKIDDQIVKENNAREKALQLQERMTNATIKQMEAQTKALNKGDGLIKVEGAGLQRHLEAFMWEILKTIQVRVNADGLKMLLGT